MDLVASDLKFDWVEYSVVFLMLILSTLVGIYYTFFNKQETFKEYMLGGKSMGVYPVSMSLVASFVSGITLLGLPVEVFLYGTQYMANNLTNVTVMVITGVFYLPVYYKLQLNSIFEYLEMRFNHNVRILGTLMFALSLVLFLPAVIYVPALAFNQVTDVSVHVITPIISASCLFYTAFGGLKAVLWTDALQNMFSLFAMVFVVVVGCQRLGGVQEVLRINQEGGRLELFNMDPSPFARNTFWNVSLGCTVLYLTNMASNPGSIQRFLSVPSLRKARMVLFYSSIGFYIITNLSCFLGLVLYARYHDCYPVAAGIITNPGQMVPLYVMELGRDYPGLAGLFMSGVLSAALSTMSSWLNTLGGTLYKDIMEVFFPNIKHSEAKQSTIIKTIVVSLGIISVAMVVVVERLGTILQMSVSLLSLVYGSILSLFTLGIFFPRVNSKGALAGVFGSAFVSGWIILHANYYMINGNLQFPGKITSVDHCPAAIPERFNVSNVNLFTYTGIGTPTVTDGSVSLLYQLSYNYYAVVGTLTGLVLGVVVSLLTEAPDPTTLNPDLFSTYVHWALPSKAFLQTHPNKNEYILSVQKEKQVEAERIKEV